MIAESEKTLAEALKQAGYRIEYYEGEGCYVDDLNIDIQIIADEGETLFKTVYENQAEQIVFELADTAEDVLEIIRRENVLQRTQQLLHRNSIKQPRLNKSGDEANYIYTEFHSVFYEDGQLMLEEIDGSVGAYPSPEAVIERLIEFKRNKEDNKYKA